MFSLRRRNPKRKEDLNSMYLTQKEREDPAAPVHAHPKVCAGCDRPQGAEGAHMPLQPRLELPRSSCRNLLDAGMPNRPGTVWAGAKFAAGSHHLCFLPITAPVHSHQCTVIKDPWPPLSSPWAFSLVSSKAAQLRCPQMP